MKTYITSTEMTYSFSNFSEYTAAQQTWALQQSYLLVNSYIRPEVQIPPVEIWDGHSDTIIAPSVLKHAQAELCKYLLIQRNQTWEEDVDNIKNSVVEMLRGLETGEIGIETQVFDSGVGITITNAQLSGSGDIQFHAPDTWFGDEEWFVIEIDTTDDTTTYYPYGQYNSDAAVYPTYKWKTKSSDWIQTEQRCSNYWQSAGNLTFRFMGSLSAGDTWTIHCVPESRKNSSAAEVKTFQQKLINY